MDRDKLAQKFLGNDIILLIRNPLGKPVKVCIENDCNDNNNKNNNESFQDFVKEVFDKLKITDDAPMPNIEIFDNEGNYRPLQDIFEDLYRSETYENSRRNKKTD